MLLLRHLKLAPLTATLLVAFGCLRIVDTHKTLSATWDEPIHVAAGVELLDRGTYTHEGLHTPLARIAAGAAPFLSGARFQMARVYRDRTDSVMVSGKGYERNLALARVGVLPFFILTNLFLYLWTRSVAGAGTAVGAVGILSFTPPVLAHAGLATTDTAAMSSFTALVLAFQIWLDRPASLGRTVWLGITAGVAAASKLSTLLFFGLTGLVMVVNHGLYGRLQRDDQSATTFHPFHWRYAALVVLIAAVTLHASYGFSIGRSLGFPAPLSEFAFSVMLLLRHNIDGELSYLLGETYVGGRWAFFPVALAVKTPIPVLLLATLGGGIAVRRWWNGQGAAWLTAPVVCVAILSVACLSSINLGVRHILPIFPALALLGGVGAVALWRTNQMSRSIVVGLLAWLFVGTWRAHPDYLASFNELAPDPGAVLVDSDLDWGQDLKRLADTVRARGISQLTIAYFGSPGQLSQLFPNVRQLGPDDPRPTGWLAVSETLYRRGWARRENGTLIVPKASLEWLRAYKPVALIGRTIRLYSIPASSTGQPIGGKE